MTTTSRTAEFRPLFHPYALPALVPALLFLVAMGMLFQYGFRAYVPGSLDAGGATLANFGRMAKWLYVQGFIDTVKYSMITALAALALGYPLAYAMVRARSAWLRSALLIVTISPLFTGDMVRNYAWLVTLGKSGFVNAILVGAGLAERPLEILFTPFAVVLALVQLSMPVTVVILAAALNHVDRQYERAAASLGAGPGRAFWHVTLPLTSPGIVAAFTTVFAWTMSAFATPQLVGGGRVNMIANIVYNAGFSNFDFPLAAILSLTALALTLAMLALVRRALRRFERMEVH